MGAIDGPSPPVDEAVEVVVAPVAPVVVVPAPVVAVVAVVAVVEGVELPHPASDRAAADSTTTDQLRRRAMEP
jgi:hypothetical protein